MKTIVNMDMEFTCGPTVASTMVSGKMVDSMAKDCTGSSPTTSLGKASGTRVSDKSGWMREASTCSYKSPNLVPQRLSSETNQSNCKKYHMPKAIFLFLPILNLQKLFQI